MIIQNKSAIPFPKKSGYFGIGIKNIKSTKNIGTIWRSAQIMGANFCFTIGETYTRMKTDTLASTRHIPLFHFNSFQDFITKLPGESQLVGVELTDNSTLITEFKHPKRAVYLLGSENLGLSEEALQSCHQLVQLPGEFSLNVSVVGSIIMYDRLIRN